MSRRLKQLLALTSTLALLTAAGCKKDEKADGDKGAKDNSGKTTDTDKAKPKEPAKPKMVEMALPKTGLKIMLPEGSKIDEAIIEGADQVNFPGVSAAMIVKPRLVTDKELDKHMEWANGHQIQKFKREILKDGSGKTYTYIHEVDMSGMTKAVFMQMFQIGDKDFACFSNADNEAAAMAMKASCDTVKAGGDAAGAAKGGDDAADKADGADKADTAVKKDKKDEKDKGGW